MVRPSCLKLEHFHALTVVYSWEICACIRLYRGRSNIQFEFHNQEEKPLLSLDPKDLPTKSDMLNQKPTKPTDA